MRGVVNLSPCCFSFCDREGAEVLKKLPFGIIYLMRGVKVLNQRSCLLFTNPSPTLFFPSQNIICTFLIPNPLVKLSDLSLAVGYSTHAIHDFKQSGSLSFSPLAISFPHFPHSIARNTGDRITVLSCYGNIVNSARRIAGTDTRCLNISRP